MKNKPTIPFSLEVSKLYSQAFKCMPNSPKQLRIRAQIEELLNKSKFINLEK